MMEVLKSWILQLVDAAILTAAATALAPEGRMKKIVALVCGFVMVSALLSITIDFDFQTFSKSMASYRQEAEEIVSYAEDESAKMTRVIIQQECEAYIFDKGTALEIEITEVSVSAEWSEEGYWYPYKVELVTNADENGKKMLSGWIEAELGIPQEDQIWSTDDEKE